MRSETDQNLPSKKSIECPKKARILALGEQYPASKALISYRCSTADRLVSVRQVWCRIRASAHKTAVVSRSVCSEKLTSMKYQVIRLVKPESKFMNSRLPFHNQLVSSRPV